MLEGSLICIVSFSSSAASQVDMFQFTLMIYSVAMSSLETQRMSAQRLLCEALTRICLALGAHPL